VESYSEMEGVFKILGKLKSYPTGVTVKPGG